MTELREIIEKELNNILEPFLGKVEYGNLRKSKKAWGVGMRHPSVPHDSLVWALPYEFLFGSTAFIFVFLTPQKTIIVEDYRGQGKYSKVEETLSDLRERVLGIPERRLEEIKNFRQNYPDLNNFFDALKSRCEENNCKQEDLYTLDELTFAMKFH